MKGISKITNENYKLFEGQEYDILNKFTEGGTEFYKFRTGDGTLYVLCTSLMIPIYEIGDIVKIVKVIPTASGATGKEELGKTATIYHISDDKFPYYLKELVYTRCAEELEIVITRYELEEEREKKKNMKFVVSDEADVTLKNNNTNEIVFKGKATTPIINNNIEAKTYEKGDILKITDGLFKDIEGTFIDYVEGYDKVLIQIDDMNRLYVDSTTIMLSKKKVNNTHEDEKTIYDVKDLDGNFHEIKVRFHKNHTYVILKDGTKSRTSCHPNDEFNERDGVYRSFYRSMVKRYTKALEDLNLEN